MGAGLTSAILCRFAPGIASHWFVPGAIFGGAIVAYLALFEGYRTPLRFVAFLGACSVAFPLSILGAMGSGILIRAFTDTASQPHGVPLQYLFVGGGIGSFIVLFSGVLLFGPVGMSRAAIGAIGLCVILSAFLVTVTGAVGREPATGSFSLTALFVVWQSSVALLLGLLLKWTRGTSAMHSIATPMSRRSRNG
jgi:hypothetical protein